MFKLAITAGHYRYEPGRRCSKSLDPNQTREWVLNSRIAEKVEALLKEYDGIEILRTDDRSGESNVPLETRTSNANAWGADFYLSIHHNGGAHGGTGGGIVAFVHTKPSEESLSWQKALYNALIEKTGLRGNRSTPLAKKNLHEVREPKMPAVLLELGFMDSKTDVPIILTEAYADQCAEAIAEVIKNRAGLTKEESVTNTRYKVQVGSFSKKSNAEEMLERVKAAGFDAIIKIEELPKETPSESPEREAETIFAEGDAVKMSKDATVYGTTKKFSSWVYNSVLYVRQISGERIVISTQKSGAVTGSVNKAYLTKI